MTLTAEALYPINFTQLNKIFAFTTMEATAFCLLTLLKYINSKQKRYETKGYKLCLGNVSKYITINNMKKRRDWIRRGCKFFLLLLLILLILLIF